MLGIPLTVSLIRAWTTIFLTSKIWQTPPTRQTPLYNTQLLIILYNTQLLSDRGQPPALHLGGDSGAAPGRPLLPAPLPLVPLGGRQDQVHAGQAAGASQVFQWEQPRHLQAHSFRVRPTSLLLRSVTRSQQNTTTTRPSSGNAIVTFLCKNILLHDIVT